MKYEIGLINENSLTFESELDIDLSNLTNKQVPVVILNGQRSLWINLENVAYIIKENEE